MITDRESFEIVSKSLDAAWVRFDEITVESVRNGPSGRSDEGELPRTEITFRDGAGL
jgi:hypothetical protein